MTNWLILALSAPVLWAVTNVFDGTVRRHFVKSDFALMWITSVSRLPFVALFFWLGGLEIPATSTMLFMFLGGILWTAPMFLYFKALEFEEPSRIALFLQLVPIFTLVIAYFVLGERLVGQQGIAFILLMVAGLFAALKRMKGKWHLSQALFLILLAGFLWALSDVLFKKFEMEFTNFYSAFAIYFFGSFLVSLTAYIPKKGRRNIIHHFSGLTWRVWRMIAVSMIAGVGGSLFFAYALTLGKASLTAVIIGTQPLFVILIGLLLSLIVPEIKREPLDKTTLMLKGISFVCLLVGLILLHP